MGHVSTKTNQQVKYQRFVINSSKDNERKPCLHVVLKMTLVNLAFDLESPTSLRSYPYQDQSVCET